MMVNILPVLFVRVWKYLVFLSIEFVVQLSTRYISFSIGLPSIYMNTNAIFISISYSYTYTMFDILITILFVHTT
jgi:hypothetical protein